LLSFTAKAVDYQKMQLQRFILPMEKNFGLELKKMGYSGWRQGTGKFSKSP
jgi:hypothetical protein